MKILAINPGSTSTKIAIFDDCKEIYSETLRHSTEEISDFPKIIDQYEFRKKIILDSLKKTGLTPDDFDAVVGRGGLLKPIPGGVYKVNDNMIDDLRMEILGEHASNLGAFIAHEITQSATKKIDAFIVDPVVVDELQNIARYSGRPELPRISIFHALNQKAVARRYAREQKSKYEDLNLIVVHLGGGITVGAHFKGKVIDVNNGLDGEGPFSPERSGSLPVGALTKLCFSNKYQIHEVRKMITGKGGLVAYLNTNNANEVEERIINGDIKASEIYEAMAYQIAKEIGSVSVVFKGMIDAILITGGLAKSDMLTDWIKDRVEFLAPVKVYPGEDEMQALAEGVYFALKGELEIKEYK
jgi:butyrate kinase